MRWPAGSIAQFAAGAGFRDDGLLIATALALAATGGEESYYVRAPASAPVALAGLWALREPVPRPDDWPDLLRAREAAAALRACWTGSGRTFDWHPAYLTPAYRRAVVKAAAAIKAGAPGKMADVEPASDGPLVDLAGSTSWWATPVALIQGAARYASSTTLRRL